MCAPSQGAMLPYGLKVPSPYFPFGPNSGLSQVQLSALDFQRSQMNDYNIRVQLGLRNYQNAVGLSSFHAYFNDPYTQAYFYKHDPRSRFVQEEPKPSHSYIGLIGMAILNSKEKKLVLSDIYQWILDNYPYFRTRGPGWRNSIRHNLSLNDCFIKAGRSANGKGHYWAVHPANVEDFERGDFRRRRAQRKVRRHMGLSVPDDDDSPTPSPTQSWTHHDLTQGSDASHTDAIASPGDPVLRPASVRPDPHHLVISHSNPTYGPVPGQPRKPSRKRLFDMASLLAPDDEEEDTSPGQDLDRHHKQHIHVSGFMFHPIQEQKSRSLKTEPSSDQRTENMDCDSAHDLTSTSKRSSSDSVKGMSYMSDDDHENDEIQVTSGEESPSHEHDDSFYTSHSYSADDKSENDNNSFNGSKVAIEPLKVQQNHTSSPQNKECKKDSALDLSSPTYFESEKKLGDSSNRVDFGDSFESKVPSPRSKDNGIRLLQTTSQPDDTSSKKETSCDKCSMYGASETASERCGRSASKTNCSGCERMRQIDSDTMMSQLPYRERCQAPGEQLCPVINGVVDHVRSSADKSHYYRTELQDPRRPHNQDQIDSKFGPLDSGLPESDRHNDSDRTLPPESSIFVSEASRVTGDQMRWTDNSKMVLARDRLSAFSSLGMRNHNIYSPFQLRNFSLAPQRHVSATTPMRSGMPDPSLPLSASSSASISLMNGLNSSASKNSHPSNDIISTKNTTNCSNIRE